MPSRSSKKPKKDFSQIAFDVVSRLTGGKPEATPGDVSKALNDDSLRREVMREMGRRGGAKGGKARASSLSPEKRAEIATKAAKARWKKDT
jgi:hypothetical protein